MPRKYIPWLKWPVAFGVLCVPVLAALLWPMSFWLEVRTVHVNDARADEPITMLVDREIKRGFFGTYNVTVHRWTNRGPEAYCTARGEEWDYAAGAVYPVPLTLRWWVGGKRECSALPPGQYQVTTRWVNLGNFLPLPAKSLTVVSNIFTVQHE